MVALQIRDVDDEVREALVRRARERGQSLQGFLHELVVAEARRSRNVQVLRRFSGRADGAEGVDPDEVCDLVREEREERTARSGAPQGPEDG